MADAFATAMRRLAKAIREKRLQENLTQEAVAERAGIAPRYLQDIEAGRYANPSLQVAWNIARALNTTLAELLVLKTAVRQTDRERASKRH